MRQINDAHAHLFSRAYYAELLKQKIAAEPSESELRETLSKIGIDLPPQDPAEHAARWIKEMDWHGVGRMVLFSSSPGEQTAVARAVKAFPNRFVGFTMVNPLSSRAFETVQRDLTELGLRGIELFPAMFRFSPADEKRVYPFYELALKFSVPVFCHVGILRVKLREVLGLPSRFDISFGNPLLLHRAAADFPGLKFVIPHLGCGFLREAALLGHQCPNVYVDTSSSNTWLKLLPESPTLARALQVCLEAFGPDRILFGTDSSTFPRGYRSDVLHDITSAFNELRLEATIREKILSDNFNDIMG